MTWCSKTGLQRIPGTVPARFMALESSLAEGALREALGSPKQLVVWSGAGIGVDSGLPLGNALTQRILRAIFDGLPINLGDISQVYERFYPDNKRTCPRLEFILGRLTSILGEGCLGEILSVFGGATLNDAHRWLVWKARQGSALVTANFDRLIEDVDESIHVLHYHGYYDAPRTCGATLQRIALGVEPDVRSTLDGLLTDSKTVLFLGYDGGDYYDVNKYFEARPRSLRKGIYIDFLADQPLREVPDRLDRLRSIERAFRGFHVYRGDPRMSLYAKETRQTNWEQFIGEALIREREGSEARVALLAVDILIRMGLDRFADIALSHAMRLAGARSQTPSEKRLRISLWIRVNYGLSRFQSVLRALARHEDMDASLREYYAVSAATFGAFKARMAWTLLKGLVQLLRYRASRIPPTRVIAVHAFGHQLQQVLLAIEGRARAMGVSSYSDRSVSGLRAFVFQHALRFVDRVRAFMRPIFKQISEEYEAASHKGIVEYDEDIGAQMSTTLGSSDWASVGVRWTETDNFKGLLIARRQEMKARVLACETVTEADLVEGLKLSEDIGAHYETVMWGALVAERGPSAEKKRAKEAIERALSSMEMSRSGRSWVGKRAYEQARSGR